MHGTDTANPMARALRGARHLRLPGLRRYASALAALALLALLALAPQPARAAYTPDPGFNTGNYYVDAFAGSASRNYSGQKIVRLDNGDVIVAGVVPHVGAGSNPINLGLVRYNAAGQRVAWENPGSFGFNANQYIVYPNSNDISTNNASSVNEVKDMKVFGSRLFVLVDGSVEAPAIGPARPGARVIVFTLGGALLGTTRVGPYNIRGGGIALYETVAMDSTTLVFAGNTEPALGTPRPYFSRYSVAANGGLSLVVEATPNPGNYCPADRGCVIRGVALGRSITGVSNVYLAGGRQAVGADWDFLLMGVTVNGAQYDAFSDDGVTTVAFDEGGSNVDIANTIVVSRPSFGDEEIYLAGNVAQSCRQGVGVAKFTRQGDPDIDFGDVVSLLTRNGRAVVGGSDAPLCVLASGAAHGLGAVVHADRIAVAGYVQTPSPELCGGGTPCPEDRVDAAAFVLDAVTGDIVSSATYPFAETVGGPRSRHSTFSGVVAGDGDFTLAGSARFLQAGAGAPAGAQQYATLRIVLGAGVFADGFEAD